MPSPVTSADARFSSVLEGLASAGEPRLSLRELVDAFGERAFGAVILLVSLLNLLPLPPGGTTVTGAPLVLLSAQLLMGRETLWLPRRLLDASISRSRFAGGVAKILPRLRRAERLTAHRLPAMISPLGERFIGLACLLLAIVLVLPIPFGNFAPALAMAIFGFALMARDGLAAIVGWATTAGAVAILVVVWKTVKLAALKVVEHWPG
jgi:hypothetical protein